MIEKKLNLSDLKPGMVTSKDIVNTLTNEIIIKKNTEITESDLEKLKNYQFLKRSLANTISASKLTAKYWEDATTQLEEEAIRNGSIPSLKEKERELFINFRRNYDNSEKKAQEYLTAIDHGEAINLPNLFSLTSSIMSGLNTKSDAFTFLGHLKKRDDYTFAHGINLSILCNIFGKWLGYSDEDIMNLTIAGLLNDIGNLNIDTAIINKKERLTKEEFDIIKMHPVYGYDIIKSQDIPEEIKLAVLQHHERIDGSGYPSRLTEAEISRLAKIVAICDVYEAMVSERPYRSKLCPFDVIKEFERFHYGKLDTQFLMVFLKNIAYNYLGCLVELSNGEKGEVVFINDKGLSSPIVQLENGTCLDLLYNKDITILHVI